MPLISFLFFASSVCILSLILCIKSELFGRWEKSEVKSSPFSEIASLIKLSVKVSEASVSRNRSTIIVPAGSTRDEGWAAFRNILAEINEASRLFILPNQVSLC